MKAIQSFKVLMILLAVVCLSVNLNAQDDKSKRPSPPATATGKAGNTTIEINYSQPAVKGREIWGALIPYDKVWRTGANEATTFEVSTDVTIEGKELKAGKYGLFTIPGKENWIIIFNENPDQWGAFSYDASKDALRVTVKPNSAGESTERMTFTVDNNGKVGLAWEKLSVGFQVKSK